MEILTPIIVSFLTSGFKKAKSVQLSGYKKKIGMFIAATLSFAAVFVKSLFMPEAELDVVSVQMFAESFLVFAESTGLYFLGKKTNLISS